MIEHTNSPNLLVRLTKRDFLHMILTDKQLERAEYLSNKTMMNDHSMRWIDVYSSKMAEVAYEAFFGIEISDTNDYDFKFYNKVTCDIKSKKVRQDFPGYDHYNEVYNDIQKTDYYAFAQVCPENNSVWLLGYITKKEFFDNSYYVIEGDKKPNDDYVVKDHPFLWCMRTKYLNPISDYKKDFFKELESNKEIITQENKRESWDSYFMTMCYIIATRSKDESTKHGCVIVTQDNRVMSTGYNSFPSGINDYVKERQSPDNGEKYFWIEHSERNAIYSASKYGISLNGCRLYVQGTPCADCARAIIQSGIIEVVIHKTWDKMYKDLWVEHKKRSLQMFEEANIKLIEWDGQLLDLFAFFRCKKIEIRDGFLQKV